MSNTNLVAKDVMDWWEVAFCDASHRHVLEAQWEMLKKTNDPTFKNALLLVEQTRNRFYYEQKREADVYQGTARSIQP